ncbi:protein-lysine N-methyltransferase EEF2KMT isoform X1 [Pantherophis guttatus]|uniref:Protein-lysine N-methyltransferase EEF2KMT isoform X1 n=1 Tax=Pantherophis guttatus TaxID=94885 RepID=A0A6P9CAF9_PANGU|nr:protein-lysine N-methyltransferase EEF2KMT isoform X1 [Pantherophis guttatus]
MEEEGGQALEEKAALGFQRGFLAGKRLAELPWESLEEVLKYSEDSSPFLAILQKTVHHPLCLKYPPSVQYRRRFLSELIKKHESTSTEPLDQLYEALGVVLNCEETTHCYKNYLLPSGDAITLRENVAIVSQGTTGLVTWDAGLYLAEWALENSEVFRNRRILELGSGIGLTGIAVCKTCHPRWYVFSDHHKAVLQQLSENIHLNSLTLEPESCSHRTEGSPNHQGRLDVNLEGDHVRISVKELDWNLVSKDKLAKLQADVILAADVVYDPEVSQHLIGVLQKFPRDGGNRQKPEVYIAFNIRNPDTYHDFQMQLDKVEIGWETVATSWKNLFPYDQHANIVILRLHI